MRAALLVLLAGCLNVPAFGGRDGGTGDDGRGIAGDGESGSGTVTVHVVSRDGSAAPVSAARIIARDQGSRLDGPLVTTDAAGRATVPVAGPSTLFVATPDGVASGQLVAIEDVAAGDAVEIGAVMANVGSGAFVLTADWTSAATSDTTWLYTPCGSADAAGTSSAITAQLDKRCDGAGTVPALLWEKSADNIVVKWAGGTFEPGPTAALTESAATVGATSFRVAFAMGAEPLEKISGTVHGVMLGERVGEMNLSTNVVTGYSANYVAATPGNLLEVEAYAHYTDTTLGLTLVRSRTSIAQNVTLPLSESAMPPYVSGTAQVLPASAAVEWTESAGLGQLDPTLVVADFTTPGGQTRWIAPGNARSKSGTTVQLQLVAPPAFAAFDATNAATGPAQVTLVRLGVPYAAARATADLQAGKSIDFITGTNTLTIATGLSPQSEP